MDKFFRTAKKILSMTHDEAAKEMERIRQKHGEAYANNVCSNFSKAIALAKNMEVSK